MDSLPPTRQESHLATQLDAPRSVATQPDAVETAASHHDASIHRKSTHGAASRARSSQPGSSQRHSTQRHSSQGGSLPSSAISQSFPSTSTFTNKILSWVNPRPIVPDGDYIENRRIGPPSAGTLGVWSIVVSLVLPGSYYGFNYVYIYGLGTTLIAYFIVIAIFIVLLAMFADLSTAFPFSSGCAAYSYAAFGGLGATFVGYAYLFSFIISLGNQVWLAGNLLSTICATDIDILPGYWIGVLTFGLMINLFPRRFFAFNTIVAVLSASILLIGLAICAVYSDFRAVLNIGGRTTGISISNPAPDLPKVLTSIIALLFMFVGFESVPVVAEETVNTDRVLPRAIWSGLTTVVILSTLAILITAGAPPGIDILQKSEFPLIDSIAVIFKIPQSSLTYRRLSVIGVPAIVLSIPAFLYATSRYMYALARGGYLPTPLALTAYTGSSHTPYMALVVTSLSALVYIYVVVDANVAPDAFLEGQLGVVLLGYLADCVIYIKLSIFNIRHISRPAHSPFGIIGTSIAALVLLLISIGFFYERIMKQKYPIAILVVYGIVIMAYLFVVRRNLLNIPERVFIQRVIKERKRDAKARREKAMSQEQRPRVSSKMRSASVPEKSAPKRHEYHEQDAHKMTAVPTIMVSITEKE